ncbi:MAG TPA: hypothetical protein VGY48_15990 [Vicinamibacterales bacterium]|jgi:hypothetical protein|nr:hypothetical protein [Vicinamibacterales bacterium]
MSGDPVVKEIKSEEFIQEGEVTLTVDNIGEVKNALAVIAKLRRTAIEALDVDEEPAEDGEIVVTSVEYRVEGEKVVVHVTQGIVE